MEKFKCSLDGKLLQWFSTNLNSGKQNNVKTKNFIVTISHLIFIEVEKNSLKLFAQKFKNNFSPLITLRTKNCCVFPFLGHKPIKFAGPDIRGK